jgi:hypothetical protein
VSAKGLTSSNKYFEVVVLPPTDGSWQAKLQVIFAAAALAAGEIGSKIEGQAYDVFLAEGVDRALHALKDRATSWKWRIERSSEATSTDPAWDGVGDTYQSLQCERRSIDEHREFEKSTFPTLYQISDSGNKGEGRLIEISGKAIDSIVYPIPRSASKVEIRIDHKFGWTVHLLGEKEPRHRIIPETPLNPGEDAQNLGE